MPATAAAATASPAKRKWVALGKSALLMTCNAGWFQLIKKFSSDRSCYKSSISYNHNGVLEKISKQIHFNFFRLDRKRTANGTERIPNGLRTDFERIPNGPRTNPERTPNGFRTNPERTPHKVATNLERTPHGPRAQPIYSETPLLLVSKLSHNIETVIKSFQAAPPVLAVGKGEAPAPRPSSIQKCQN